MTTIFDLPGKKIKICEASLSIDIKFDLWKDYTDWLDEEQRLDYWHNIEVLKNSDVAVEVSLNNKIIAKHIFKEFDTIHIKHDFDDENNASCNLDINIVNLDDLPVRDDTGIFVSGMIEIQSVNLQGIEIKHLLENTLLGKDTQISLAMTTPVYQWMVTNQSMILNKAFDFLY